MNLEKIVLELLGRIQNLEERVDRLERTDRAVSEEKRSFPADDISNKYRPLAEYLFDKNEKKIIMTYKEIEEILGLTLPKTAYKYPQSFWANTETHSYSSAWMKVGYMARIKFADKKVIFEKSL